MSVVIGICGGSGAGKTFLANLLKEHFKDRLIIIPFDSYCKDRSNYSVIERGKINYDIPDSYDGDLLASDLKKIKEGQPTLIPQFDFATHTRKKEKKLLLPTDIILVEGIMTFSFPSVVRQLDYKIYVDALEEIRFARRLNRDINERGRSKESVYKQFYETVAPMHNIYIEPWKHKSDYVVINNGNDGLDISNIVNIIMKLIQR
jgi:uridine kinase